ncbi:MAG: hypothetical protein IKJ65_02405 [Clostridia bacterium]|nr:hypothetical protein [Clostridia bacterium]
MKKPFVILLIVSILVFSSAQAEITLSDSPIHQDSVIAANEFGAQHAYFSPLDDYIYYVKSDSEGTNVVMFDASSSAYTTIKTFSPEADYISVSADSDGSVYLLRRDHDETAKSGLVCLAKEADDYTVLEYLFPAASGEMIPVSFEFSPYSSLGAVRFMLNCQGDYLSFVSPVSVFWGSLMGTDELIYIVPGDLTAKVQPMDELFDAYGYQTEKGVEFLKKAASGEYLSPLDISLSPSGNMLLMLVPFEDEKLIYVMDLYTNGLEILYLPDEFSGSVSWTHEGAIETTDAHGEKMIVEWNGFSAGDWNTAGGFEDIDQLTDWSDTQDETLSDWS